MYSKLGLFIKNHRLIGKSLVFLHRLTRKHHLYIPSTTFATGLDLDWECAHCGKKVEIFSTRDFKIETYKSTCKRK